MGQTGRGLLTRYEGHTDVMKYKKFQAILVNRHAKCEGVLRKTDAGGKGSNFHVLNVGETQIKNNFMLFMLGFDHDKNK